MMFFFIEYKPISIRRRIVMRLYENNWVFFQSVSNTLANITDDNGKFDFSTRFGEAYELRFIHPLYTFPHGVAKGVAWGQHVRISVAEKQ